MRDFIDDNDAWNYLKKRGFAHHKGVIYDDLFKKRTAVLTKKEKQAIEYLISEWDWNYSQSFSCPNN